VSDVTELQNFEIPSYNFGMNTDIHMKFGIEIDDKPLLRPDQKTTHKWVSTRSHHEIS